MFTVAVPPVITELQPAHGSEHLSVLQVSAKVTSNGEVDWESVTLKVKNNLVEPQINESTGVVSYNANFAYGTHQIQLDVKDLDGLAATRTWDFVVDNKPPDLTRLRYFSDGMTISDNRLRFEAQLNDLVDSSL
jgi:hypothetical protein